MTISGDSKGCELELPAPFLDSGRGPGVCSVVQGCWPSVTRYEYAGGQTSVQKEPALSHPCSATP